MKVVVVGGAGYIGSHTARILRQHGHEVVVYDDLSTGFQSLAQGFPLVRASIADSEELSQALRGAGAVMHFAAHASVGESVQNPRKYFANNVQSGLALLNACLASDVRKFIFSSSCSVYGVPTVVPITENTALAPVSPYGVSKMFFERALEAYSDAYGLRFAALRYFNAAGADEGGEIGEMHDPETHLIPLALQAARGSGSPLQIFGEDYPTPDGTCVRDYIHVNDLAEAHVLALHHLDQSGKSLAVNLGTGTGHSVKEVIACVEKATGRAVPHSIAPRRPGDPPALVADPSLAQQLLRWKARYTLDHIVSTAWKWMQNQSVGVRV
jgi:UDP-glucose-4-epimerase GalE